MGASSEKREFGLSEFRLGPKARGAGFRFRAFDSVGSTNNEAAAASAKGDPGNIWFAALQQTTGRGRRGRKWESAYGNLAASLLLRPNVDPTVAATLGFVAGVALCRALREIMPETINGGGDIGAGSGAERCVLKWPNDVLADGAKLAGILLEAQTGSSGALEITIGIGVNVVSAPQGLPYPTICTNELGASADAQKIFELLAEHWVDVYAMWDNGAGISRVLNIWRQYAAGVGNQVIVNVDDEIIQGIFEAIDDTGRLIVKTNDGQTKAIAAGDVHFGAAASIKSNERMDS